MKVALTGAVSCSDAASLNGYGGNPQKLVLSTASVSRQTLPYPFHLTGPITGATYRPPSFQGYAFTVTIPAGPDEVTVNWQLDCRDQNGQPTGHYAKSFDVTRSGGAVPRRTIGSHGGVFPVNPCVDPKYNDALGSCAAAVLTAGLHEDALEVGHAVLDNDGWWFAVKAGVAIANPAAGIAPRLR